MELTKVQKKTALRRLLALALALTLTVGLLPAFAAEGETDAQTTAETAAETTAETTTETSAETSSDTSVEVWAQSGEEAIDVMELATDDAPVPEKTATTMQDYLDQAVEWGVMRGDQNGDLDAEGTITRAEFVAMVNRAYGYTTPVATPFTDVQSSDWYYDDIGIAYGMGYFHGTSATTASPLLTLTREEAAVLVARNLLLEETTGETLGFSDSRDLQEWSRGLIQSLADAGVVNGFSDGSFRPQASISKGEVAAMLVRSIGTPVQNSGEYTLGDVYGNVTISTSDVTLKDTTIAGDLYLTGGVGLGNVNLENVNVLGKIVVSGSGESEKADSSILLRNVTAENMVVDSISDQFITLRSEGDTSIGTTTVRTSSYIEDMAEKGLNYIELDGDEGITLQVAGLIKEIRNKTANSTINVAQGAANVVTVDEAATGSKVTIDNGARIKELNLDTATTVDGDGDIATLNVFAPGSIVSILPDEITVRPGVTADIAGQNMDSVAAAESSATPRILAGYPTAKQIAPTSAQAVFSTNKTGTLYWAVSAQTDGSVTEEDLITPPAYGGNVLLSGSIQVTAANTEVTAALSKLTSAGSYYLSAVLVDARGLHSAVKVATFSTPDDTVPAFVTGYPTMTRIKSDQAQVTVMPNKSCLLYYALLPKGSVAPTTDEFKANAVTGNLGFGTMDVVKNTTSPFWVNDVPLEELETYDLYLWLTDYDNAKSSAVTKLTFTTVDETPPIIRYVNQTDDTKPTSVEITFALNEPGTLYWAVVKEGESILLPLSGQTATPALNSEAAKIQIENGLGALQKGGTAAAKADTDVKFNITGLEAQTAYDLYYIAKDKAGNYSSSVQKVKINTLDNQPPTATQEFTEYQGDNKEAPMPDTDIRLVFSESIQLVDTDQDGQKVYYKLAELYQDVTDSKATEEQKAEARQKLADELEAHIKLYFVPTSGAPQIQEGYVPSEDGTDDKSFDGDWTIDYRYARVSTEDGKMVVIFPTVTGDNGKRSALNLGSGATYYFTLSGIADTARVPNTMGTTTLPNFTTVAAQVILSESEEASLTGTGSDPDDRLDVSFQLTPVSTSRVNSKQCWDMLIWVDSTVDFKLYRRELDKNDKPKTDWVLLPESQYYENGQNKDQISVFGTTKSPARVSLRDTFYKDQTKDIVYEPLNTLDEDTIYEYGIQFTKVNKSTNSEEWNGTVNLQIAIAQGGSNQLKNLARGDSWENLLADKSITSIGFVSASTDHPDRLSLKKTFSDQRAPQFAQNRPLIVDSTSDLTSTTANIQVVLDRRGLIYYAVAPAGVIIPATDDGSKISIQTIPDIVVATEDSATPKTTPSLARAMVQDMIDLESSYAYNTRIKIPENGDPLWYRDTSTMNINLDGLEPDTDYCAYFVLQGCDENGVGSTSYSDVYVYKFHTNKREVPAIDLRFTNNAIGGASNNHTAYLYTTHAENSYVQYCLIDMNDLAQSNSFLLDPLMDDVNDNEDYDDAAKESAKTVLGDKTVLEAMQDNPTGYDYTYFDLYASEELKKKVVDFIAGRYSQVPESTLQPEYLGSLENVLRYDSNAKNIQRLVFEEIPPATRYYLLTTAVQTALKDTTDYTNYGFRALTPVFRSTGSPPVFGNLSVALKEDGSGDTFSGTISLTLSNALYCYVYQSGSSGKYLTVLAKDEDADLDVSTLKSGDSIPLANLWGGTMVSNGRVSFKKEGTGPTNTFDITCDKLEYGEALIIFNNDYYFADANGASQQCQLTIQFVKNYAPVIPDDGYVIVEQTIVDPSTGVKTKTTEANEPVYVPNPNPVSSTTSDAGTTQAAGTTTQGVNP
jgi:hypothetical protein